MENLNNYARADVHNDMAGTAVAARVSGSASLP